MDQTRTPKAPAATLTHSDKPGNYILVEGGDGDRFTLPLNLAIMACKSVEKQPLFLDQFRLLLRRIGEWLERRADEIERGMIVFEDLELVFLVVRKDVAFNPEFEDALSMLDLEIANAEAFDLINLRVMALPNCSEEAQASFLNVAPSNTVMLR